jgi:hypothetical protein
MSFTGLPRGRRKVLSNIRIVHNGGGNSSLIVDGGSPSSITYDTSAWLQLFSSTSTNVNFIEIFDSTGEIARLATGAVSSEVQLLEISPGGNGHIPVRIDAGTRLVIRPTVTPTNGSVTIINFYD